MAVDCVLSGAGHDCGHEWGRLLSLEEEAGDVSSGKQELSELGEFIGERPRWGGAGRATEDWSLSLAGERNHWSCSSLEKAPRSL